MFDFWKLTSQNFQRLPPFKRVLKNLWSESLASKNLVLSVDAFRGCFLFEKLFWCDINVKIVLSFLSCLLMFSFWKEKQKGEGKSVIKAFSKQSILGKIPSWVGDFLILD
jgi:ABC-type uncharacterized transport system permease subunit